MDDHAQQKVWSDIARAYEKVIIRTSFYERMMQDILTYLDGHDFVVDMGCGVGYLIAKLLEDPARSAIGIDTNPHMLDIAQHEIVSPDNLSRALLVQSDVTTIDPSFVHPESVDAVVSSNVLFNLQRPYDFLDTVHSLLRPGGVFVLTSARHNPNLDMMIQKTITEFEEKGIMTDKLASHINTVKQVNERFMGRNGALEKKFMTFENDEIERILLDFVGFDKILHSGHTYEGQNFLVVARKPLVPCSSIFTTESPAQEDIKRFVYHCLYDRYNLIPSRPDGRFDFEALEDETSFVAREDMTRRIIGHFILIDDISKKEYEIKRKLRNAYPDVWRGLERRFNKIGSPGKWLVHPQYQGRGIGAQLFSNVFDYSVKQGVDGWVFEINPDLLNYFKSIKSRDIGFVESSVLAPSYAMYIDLSEISRESFL